MAENAWGLGGSIPLGLGLLVLAANCQLTTANYFPHLRLKMPGVLAVISRFAAMARFQLSAFKISALPWCPWCLGGLIPPGLGLLALAANCQLTTDD